MKHLRLVMLAIFWGGSALGLGAQQAPESSAPPGAFAPQRQSLFAAADHKWTLFTAGGDVPLSLVSLENDRVLAGFAGGWLILDAELAPVPQSLTLLKRNEPLLKSGSPWAARWSAGTAVILDGEGKKLGLIYPESGVLTVQDQRVPELTHFNAVPGKKISFYQSRKSWVMDIWPREPYPDTPLTFFPSEVSTGPDDKVWGLDLISARVWAVEDGFWTPQAEPRLPSKPLSLAGGERGIFFLAGAGWLGGFDSEGQRLWFWEKDLASQKLPADPRIACGPQGIYLWSAQSRRLWFFGWQKGLAPARRITPPAPSELFDWTSDRISLSLEKLDYPEAEALAAYGQALAEDLLRSQPFHSEIRSSLALLKAQRQELRTVRVGMGNLEHRWSLDGQKITADWKFHADDSAAAEGLTIQSQAFWKGLPQTDSLANPSPLERQAQGQNWPPLKSLRYDKAYLPAYVNSLILHPSTGQRGFFRLALPLPALPQPPDERPKVPMMPH